MVHASTKKRTGTEHLKSYNGLSCEEALVRCQEALGYTFNDPQLLQAALTHASVANTRLESNERLEFLGDAVLGMVVCEELFRINPHALEGELTKIKSAVVSRRVCARVAEKLRLTEPLHLGQGVGDGQGVPRSLAAGVFEAFVAAMYLDGGLDPARRVLLANMTAEIELAPRSAHQVNYKSQ